MGKNICQCPQPPGGQASCNEDQLAICRVINGVAHTECVDVPFDPDSLSSIEGKNWLLSVITRVRRQQFQPITEHDDSILANGRYEIPGTTDVVRFVIPVNLRRGDMVEA